MARANDVGGSPGQVLGSTEAPVLAALYPEIRAGGFSRVDGTVGFYTRVQSILQSIGPGATVVDFGAGRGAWIDDPVEYRRDLRNLSVYGARVIGVDVDGAVRENASLDQAYVVDPGGRLPLGDGSVRLIVSDFTFEHIADPDATAAELDRVLAPGGWICARTPNRRGYIAVGARLVPNMLHVTVLRRLQPTKPAVDTFPTRYRLNTPADLARHFPPERYVHVVYSRDAEPAYVGRSLVAARLSWLLSSLTPSPFRSILDVFLQKRA